MKFVVIFTENGATIRHWSWTLQDALQERKMLLDHRGVKEAKVYQLIEVKP